MPITREMEEQLKILLEKLNEVKEQLTANISANKEELKSDLTASIAANKEELTANIGEMKDDMYCHSLNRKRSENFYKK